MKKFINQDDMKNVNFTDVFNLIKELKQTTRKQIESITHLSWGAVSNITSRLIESGLITESKTDKNTGPGRTPSYLEVNGDSYYAIGLDINITGIKAELVNIKNEPIKSRCCKGDFTNKDTLLRCITDFLGEILSDADGDGRNIIGIGIAMQGIVDPEKGISVRLTSCEGWDNVNLARILEEKFGIPVWLEHDPNCILLAYSESSIESDAILLRIDRGIGMALMLDGRVVGGVGMFELGQTITDGKCLEDYASISGMEKLYGKPFEVLASDAAAGSEKATEIFENMAKQLAVSIYNIQKLFNVPSVILCGDIMAHRELFMDKIKELNPDIAFSETDVSYASYGASIIAIDKAVKNIKI